MLLFTLPVNAQDASPLRDFTSTTGKKVKAKFIRAEGDNVILQNTSGKDFNIPLSALSEEDQLFIKKTITDKDNKEEEKEVINTSTPDLDLLYPQGEVVGPIDTGVESNYYLYLPKSLKKDRLAPLLFFTHSGGGKRPTALKNLAVAAEMLGWAMALSVESSNNNTTKIRNTGHSKNCMDHIFKNLPADPDRIIYTGISGGAATAYKNTEVRSAVGIIPNVGYIPHETKPRVDYTYAIGGGSDYNRYSTAYAAAIQKKSGFHRMFAGGHGAAPTDFRIDGMFWIQCKYMQKEYKNVKDELDDFTTRAVNWLQQMSKTEPMRSYSNCMILKEFVPLPKNQTAQLDVLIKELESDPKNILYHEGLLEINELSSKYLDPGRNPGSLKNHSDKDSAKQAEKLLSKYSDIPKIKEVLEFIKKKT